MITLKELMSNQNQTRSSLDHNNNHKYKFNQYFIMNLFVAKLSPSTTSQDLQKLFAHYGFVISVKVIMDHFTGKSKGYGFVEMPNVEEAQEALKELDSSLFQQAVITVKDSQPTRTSTSQQSNKYYSDHSRRGWNQHEYIRDTTINSKSTQPGSRRNFGYRGINNKWQGEF